MARILAVDDDEAIRNLLGRVLGKDGHDVRCAACAEEVLAPVSTATIWCCWT